MERDTEKWVSLEEIAEHMGLSKDTIRNYIKNNRCHITELANSINLKFQK